MSMWSTLSSTVVVTSLKILMSVKMQVENIGWADKKKYEIFCKLKPKFLKTFKLDKFMLQT